MQDITIKTGRFYDCEQVLECEFVREAHGDLGTTDYTFYVTDKSRHMQVTIKVCGFFEGVEDLPDIRSRILDAYDHGYYQNGHYL